MCGLQSLGVKCPQSGDRAVDLIGWKHRKDDAIGSGIEERPDHIPRYSLPFGIPDEGVRSNTTFLQNFFKIVNH